MPGLGHSEGQRPAAEHRASRPSSLPGIADRLFSLVGGPALLASWAPWQKELDRNALSGHWVHKRLTQVIRGGKIIGPDGSDVKLEVVGKDRYMVRLGSAGYSARLLGGALVWSDGDVWIREQPAHLFEGAWTVRRNLGLTYMISGDYLHSPDGSVTRVMMQDKRGISVSTRGGTLHGSLRNDRLYWDHGEIWLRAQGRSNPFDGRWTHKGRPGLLQLIRGEWLHGPDGSEVRIAYLGKSGIALQLGRDVHRATLRDDELVWDDGDVWVRCAAPPGFGPLDGRWTQRRGHAATEIVVGDVVLRPDGGEVRLHPCGGARFAMTCEHQTFFADLRGDELVWDDGDVWLRKANSRAEVESTFMASRSHAVPSEAASDEDHFDADMGDFSFGLSRVLRMSKALSSLLFCVPLGFVLFWSHFWPPAIVAVNFLALLPMAWLGSKSLQALALAVGGSAGRLLALHRCCAAELLVVAACLRQGEVEMIQFFVVGLVLSKLLLSLGSSLLWGGAFLNRLPLEQDGARVQGSLLLLAVLCVVLPTMHGILLPGPEGRAVTADVSRGFGLLLLSLYLQFLVFSWGHHTLLVADWPSQSGSKDGGEHSLTSALANSMDPLAALMVLTLCLGCAFCCCSYLLLSLPGAVASTRLSREFIGVVLLPLQSVVAQQGAAVSAMGRAQVQSALTMTVGSACQTALLVSPLALLAGLAVGVEVSLNFHPFQAVALLLAAAVAANALGGGSSNWLEGAALLSGYGVVVVCYFFTSAGDVVSGSHF